MTTSEIARLAETIEIRMQEAFWAALPSSLERRRGMQLHCVGGALVSVTPKSTSLQRNRVLGLGVRERASEEMVDQIMDLYRAARVTRFSFHLSPGRQSSEIKAWITRRGFHLNHRYAKLLRDTSPPPPAAATRLAVKRISRTDARAFAAIVGEVFAGPEDGQSWLAAAVGRHGFTHYLAMDGARPVAAGVVYVEGESAWMGPAATLTAYRRRGAHGALIAARLRRAAARGAKWVACATLEQLPRRPTGSYRNLLKQGFKLHYLRPIWVWEQQ